VTSTGLSLIGVINASLGIDCLLMSRSLGTVGPCGAFVALRRGFAAIRGSAAITTSAMLAFHVSYRRAHIGLT